MSKVVKRRKRDKDHEDLVKSGLVRGLLRNGLYPGDRDYYWKARAAPWTGFIIRIDRHSPEDTISRTLRVPPRLSFGDLHYIIVDAFDMPSLSEYIKHPHVRQFSFDDYEFFLYDKGKDITAEPEVTLIKSPNKRYLAHRSKYKSSEHYYMSQVFGRETGVWKKKEPFVVHQSRYGWPEKQDFRHEITLVGTDEGMALPKTAEVVCVDAIGQDTKRDGKPSDLKAHNFDYEPMLEATRRAEEKVHSNRMKELHQAILDGDAEGCRTIIRSLAPSRAMGNLTVYSALAITNPDPDDDHASV